ncbi:hypothetical protein [Mycolicibacterium llatzerense]|uniref:hypothetical protein n=1 Tax=Mycolicibacterium llatzerense TaxID=280871 RepID=UPI0021B53AF4|nr:hypothetical protein [Mycolicibacterium llatzerense]MCT7371942.1 hypothetical protein [Mycolicibacterium llatzerense]
MASVSYDATTWADRRVGTDWICTLLNIKQTSLHTLIQRGTFPQSSVKARGRPGEWPLVHVMEFVQTHRPERVPLLPRLWPRVNPPLPALFLGAKTVRVRTSPKAEYASFVVYTFEPSDGARPVALAYGLNSGAVSPRQAQGLLRELKADTPDLSAVALTNGAYYVDPAGVLEPPEIAVADDSGFDHGLRDLTWFDLAYLLQIDLPVWPWALRDRFAMERWEPGDRPGRAQVIPQLSYGRNPLAFTALGGGDRAVAEFGAAWADYIAQSLNAGESVPTTIPAGVVIAATAISPTDGRELPTGVRPELFTVYPEHTLHALNCPADARDVDALRDLATEFRVWEPWIANIIHVSAVTPNPIAQKWIGALEPAPSERADDIGWLYVCAAAQEQYRIAHPGIPAASAVPTRWLYKPHDVEVPMWIVRIGDTISLSVPTSFGNAAGVLTQFDITQGTEQGHEFTVWWLDSRGTAWPMAGRYDYTAGYDGNGPDSLAQAVSVLAGAPAAEVTPESVRALDPSNRCYTALSTLLTRKPYPKAFRIAVDGEITWQ